MVVLDVLCCFAGELTVWFLAREILRLNFDRGESCSMDLNF